jgi:hypothetical protein
MLNWRRDPDHERRKMWHMVRMKQLESEIEQFNTETEQLRPENAKLVKLNSKDDAFSALIKQHCFPLESNSTPIPPIEPNSGSS